MNFASLHDVSAELKRGNVSNLMDVLDLEQRQANTAAEYVLVNLKLALCLLHLESVRAALKKCAETQKISKNIGLLYYIQGIIHLWMNNEQEAIKIWCTASTILIDVKDASIINSLIQNQNLRANILKHKFDVPYIIDTYINFDQEINLSDYDIDTAYSELRNNSLASALTYFSLILDKDPNNLEAYRGRGIAYCLSGRWTKCIEDLDREFPQEIETDALKFLSIALASTRHVFEAISKISKAILNTPTDFESIAERGKMHMSRGLYSLALQDFKSVPEQCYTDRIWLYIAECLYSVGDILRASDAIERCQIDNDHRKHYCHYLILRSKGYYFTQEARKHILRAVEISPTFFLLRVTADFLFDIGELKIAQHYYDLALTQKPDDYETIKNSAICHFHLGKFESAYSKILGLYKIFCNDLFVDTCDKSIANDHISGILYNFNESIHFDNIRETVFYTYLFIHRFVHHFSEPIDKFHFYIEDLESKCQECSKENEETHFDIPLSLEQDEILHKLIEDSDRIGQRCIPHVMEYTSNPRLVRALGLVTLYITFCMQKNLKKSKMTLFCDIVDISCQILSFVDLRHPVLHRSSKNNISLSLTPQISLQRYERKSPRFFGIIKPAFEKMRQLLSLSTPLENVDCSEYDFGVDEFTFSRRFVEQETTYIRYKNLGSRGCDFSIFPTCNLEVLDNIDKYLERSWFNMFDILERPKQIRALCVTLQLIWSSFILTNYNVEFSYSIIQAFMISNHGIEVDRLDNDHSTELFIRHMIDPYIVGLDSLLTDHFDHKGLSKLYSTSSIEFWRRMPTYKYLFDLMNIPQTNFDSSLDK